MIALLMASALAQDTTLDNLAAQATGFSAQAFRPPVDARTSLWTERSTVYQELSATAQILGTYTMNPLVVYYLDETRAPDVLLGNVYAADLTAALHAGRLRLGVLAPVYFGADGPSVLSGGGAGLGDLALDVKLGALRDGDAPLGLAVSARVLLPTTTVDAPLGTSTTGWEAMAIIDKQLSRVVLAANAGIRGAPAVSLTNIALDDQFFYRGAISVLFDESARGGLSLDGSGQMNLKDLNSAGVPLEATLGGWGSVGHLVKLRAGVGRGFTRGIGSPDLRILAGLAIDPDIGRDDDDDGIVNREDGCPKDPEDFDSRHDEDGCPEQETNLVVVVETQGKDPVPGVKSTLLVNEIPQSGEAQIAAVVDPGSYEFSASAPGYEPVKELISVPAVADHRVVVVMKPAPVTVHLRLTDLEGKPIDAEWSLDGNTWTPEKDGSEDIELVSGRYTIYGRAEGYQDAEQPFTVRAVGTNEVWVSLGKKASLVQQQEESVSVQKIELHEVVRFKTASAEILPASYGLLNEVALIITNHPELAKIKIEGHTDSRGSDTYNLDLSDRRAASIRAYLTAKGVVADRLLSEGFGETRPIAPNDTPDNMATNRRVEIRVLERAD